MKKQVVLIVFLLIAVAIFFTAVFFFTEPLANSKNTTVPINAVAATECEKDTDCLVGGCSNQLCLPRDKAPSTVSTCEWKDEYGCYSQDSCLCRNGQCQWAGSPQFVECLEQLD